MKKQDLLDICNDIQILSKGCQVLKNIKLIKSMNNKDECDE